ncbi:alpha/beta-hydrolase [Dichomitus squalens]|uniref:Alpha/beta-hydrolase n=1 Tax=Dichomitus squalens TaxID=114155 RepID=A0A4Q9M890_9APHY|nr:alpha/beta-hydrolase [Dichomitus squalens]TBU39714.1 alpha/beta-hydrolase [Dichomitus squalens]TBU60027.1 alpha/beta-hydrolase [Dichomitus squalens]
MSLCADCFKGVRHEGTPEGTTQTIGGIESYVAIPEGDYPKDKVVLYLADAFGLKLENNLLLIDDFARNGYKVVAPDVFDGEPAPVNAFEPGVTFDFGAWISRHPPSRANTIVRSVIDALKAEGVTKFAATGYCYGGRLAFDLAFTGDVQVVAVSHPSILKTPDDLQKYFEVAKAPLLINSCEVDQQFPIESQKVADEILGDGKFAPGYQRTYWPGCVHGFAVRGDLSKPEVKAGKEGAFKATVEWFQKYL